MQIRMVTLMDEEIVYELLCELEHRQFDKARFHAGFCAQRNDATITAWLLENKGVGVGYVSLRTLYHLHHTAKIAMLEELIVKASYQHQGYGHRLFQTALAYAKSQDCVQVEVSSSRKRKDAHLFYEKEGMACRHFKFTIS